MTAAILLSAIAVVSSQADAGIAVGYLKADACGYIVHKDNAYRLIVPVPYTPKEISLLLQPNADKSARHRRSFHQQRHGTAGAVGVRVSGETHGQQVGN